MELPLYNEQLNQAFENSYIHLMDEMADNISRRNNAKIIDHLNKKFNLKINDNLELSRFALSYMRAYRITNGYRYFVNDIPFLEVVTTQEPIFDNKYALKEQITFL